MKTLHFRYKKMLALACTILFLTACANSGTPANPVDPPPNDEDPMPVTIVESYSDPEQQAKNLFIKGAAKSGIVEDLNSYSPFIIFSMDDASFRAYLTKQGVSESEFLASPNLRAFYGTHVIGDAPNLYGEINEENAVVNAETLSGKTVTIENRDDGFDNGRGRVFVDGRKLDEAPFNENNTNYDWLLLDRPIVDFPIE